ncbi:MAG: Unknown protein [uncultured Thiotrichaceae bacterium]|uniref:Intermembrane phospholipid transport system permease protein MlaE n=1 Tax=uncultured Thiotrichaceae bacterium TaxID=298394 RepID=A0A6S6SE57_9GAMM|nr:MAG: Unknown protein [uncultured Thiotrichaceae bacterium]
MIDLKLQQDGKQLTLILLGEWVQAASLDIHRLLNSVEAGELECIHIDASQVSHLDISASWFVFKQADVWRENQIEVSCENFHKDYFSYFEDMRAQQGLLHAPSFLEQCTVTIKKVGFNVSELYREIVSVITFFGHTLAVLGEGLTHPQRLRVPSIFHHVFITGISALPIIAMLAVLISIVFTYQGGTELRNLGASIYTVDLVAASILRELGVLLTALMVAGRSSSAFAAEIGIMKTNQEIDALEVAGLNPYAILVVPRMVALVIALPLLTLLADILSLIGAALISDWSLGISLSQFASRLQQNIELHTFLAGIIKAPFFAVVIAVLGTWNGMQVTGSAESLGHHTTAAVVQSIFMVLFLDAVFSILYYNIGF